MPKLIFRLVITFVVFVGIFLVIQRNLTPDSFGKYGHYRANAIEDNALVTSYYKGEQKCASCHQDIFESQDADVHSNIHCESCHSPKIASSIDCKVNPPKVIGTREFCGQCHAMNLARYKKNGVPQLNMEDHKGNQNCIECHNPHAPWELKD